MIWKIVFVTGLPGLLGSRSTQWAAVKTNFFEIMAPPQRGLLVFVQTIATWYEIELGIASPPPMIRAVETTRCVCQR